MDIPRVVEYYLHTFNNTAIEPGTPLVIPEDKATFKATSPDAAVDEARTRVEEWNGNADNLSIHRWRLWAQASGRGRLLLADAVPSDSSQETIKEAIVDMINSADEAGVLSPEGRLVRDIFGAKDAQDFVDRAFSNDPDYQPRPDGCIHEEYLHETLVNLLELTGKLVSAAQHLHDWARTVNQPVKMAREIRETGEASESVAEFLASLRREEGNGHKQAD